MVPTTPRLVPGIHSLALYLLAVGCLSGCGSDASDPAMASGGSGSSEGVEPSGAGASAGTGASGGAGASARPEGFSEDGELFYFRTAEVPLDAGEERLVCYAATVEEDVIVDRFDYDSNPLVHHLLFSRATTPEPEGLSECDVLIKFSWEPLFGAGSTEVSLQIPEGAGQTITAGTQVVIQLHLLNAGSEPGTAVAEIGMHRTTERDLEPVGIYAIGNTNIHLPPSQDSTVSAQCTMAETVEMFAVTPHMHYLGQRLRVYNGPSPSELEQIFLRDPYDFDDQRFEEKTITLPAGSTTRVECDFGNVYDHEVQFGESSLEEMCFFVGMVPGLQGFGGCANELTDVPAPVL